MTKIYALDLFERAVATYVEAFIGLVVAGATVSSLRVSTLVAAGVAAIPAGLAVLKGGLARFVGTSSASLVPTVNIPVVLAPVPAGPTPGR